MQHTNPPSGNQRQMLAFLGKAMLGLAPFLGSIAWVDSTGLFQAPPDDNPHIEKRWSSLHSLAEEGTNVDLLVLGNSHAYTGINPKHLSAELGMTAMVMANNSMSWADSYWTLKAALAHCKPQVVVVETYGLDEYAPGQRGLTHLVNQIRAFKARRSPLLQLQSAPDLFTLEELGLGLSPTVRNHHYVWESPDILGAEPGPRRAKTPREGRRTVPGPIYPVHVRPDRRDVGEVRFARGGRQRGDVGDPRGEPGGRTGDGGGVCGSSGGFCLAHAPHVSPSRGQSRALVRPD